MLGELSDVLGELSDVLGELLRCVGRAFEMCWESL